MAQRLMGTITGLADDLTDACEMGETTYEEQERWLRVLAMQELAELSAPLCELVEY